MPRHGCLFELLVLGVKDYRDDNRSIYTEYVRNWCMKNSENFLSSSQQTETISQAFQRLDEHICRLEGQCPGPRLATNEAWIDFLNGLTAPAEPTERLLDDSTNSLIVNENRMLDVRETVDQKEHQGVAKVREVGVISLPSFSHIN